MKKNEVTPMLTDRNAIAKQYIPLVNKIARQINSSSGYDFNECVNAGNVGLVYAIDNFKEGEGVKNQTFTQYAAYMIRFYILNDINKHSHIIRVNQDQQKRLKSEGKSIELTTRLDISVSPDDDKCCLSNIIAGDNENSIYASLDPSAEEIWSNIYKRLNAEFSDRDMDIFCSTFGVNGHDELKGKDIAVKYNISAGAVTQVRNKIVAYMKKDKVLNNMLVDIMQLQSGENYGL